MGSQVYARKPKPAAAMGVAMQTLFAVMETGPRQHEASCGCSGTLGTLGPLGPGHLHQPGLHRDTTLRGEGVVGSAPSAPWMAGAGNEPSPQRTTSGRGRQRAVTA